MADHTRVESPRRYFTGTVGGGGVGCNSQIVGLPTDPSLGSPERAVLRDGRLQSVPKGRLDSAYGLGTTNISSKGLGSNHVKSVIRLFEEVNIRQRSSRLEGGAKTLPAETNRRLGGTSKPRV